MPESGMWYTSLIPTFEKQVDLCEFKASLVYLVSSKQARVTQRDPVANKQSSLHRQLPCVQSLLNQITTHLVTSTRQICSWRVLEIKGPKQVYKV